MTSITSVELNYLVFRYLQESGSVYLLTFSCNLGFIFLLLFLFFCEITKVRVLLLEFGFKCNYLEFLSLAMFRICNFGVLFCIFH